MYQRFRSVPPSQKVTTKGNRSRSSRRLQHNKHNYRHLKHYTIINTRRSTNFNHVITQHMFHSFQHNTRHRHSHKTKSTKQLTYTKHIHQRSISLQEHHDHAGLQCSQSSLNVARRPSNQFQLSCKEHSNSDQVVTRPTLQLNRHLYRRLSCHQLHNTSRPTRLHHVRSCLQQVYRNNSKSCFDSSHIRF